MEIPYKIQKAQRLYYRRGQYAELRGFNTAIKLFSGKDDGLRAELNAKKEDEPSFWKKHKKKIIGGGLALAGLAAGTGLAAHTGRIIQQRAGYQKKEAEDTSATIAMTVAELTEANRHKEAVQALKREVDIYIGQPELLTDVVIANLKTAAGILKSQIAEDATQEDKMVLLPQAKALIAKINQFKPAKKSEAYALAAKKELKQDYDYAKGKVSDLYNRVKKKFE